MNDDHSMNQFPEVTRIESFGRELNDHLKGEKRRRYSRFTLAALGSIPWVGGFLSAAAAFHAEKDQSRINELHRQWFEEHKEKIIKLGQTLAKIIDRLASIGEEIETRIESPGYLSLVRKGFRSWDQADTEEKRELIRTLLTNAGATQLCPDDLIRLFIEWVDTYHEAHFKVIREIYKSPGISRGAIWDNISDERPREDFAEADLYKRLIRDLSTGGVIRQSRETDSNGRFYTKSTKGRSRTTSTYMKSAFDDVDPYELTELGAQFVHYTMTDVIPRIDNKDEDS